MHGTTGIKGEEYLRMLDRYGFDIYLVSYTEKTSEERAIKLKKPFVQLKFSGVDLVANIEMGALRKQQISVQQVPSAQVGAFTEDLECGQADILFHQRKKGL
jgi:hypothetical protein